ncbi:MAG: peroxiredoxin [Alphaproteobacteria bacterium]
MFTQTHASEAQTHTLPLIGDKAPSFVAESTKGPIHFPQDYTGRWVILFSHPSDFTPVCTTEFIMFATLSHEFEARNTALVGLSVDSLSSHIAWLYAIEQEVKFNGHENVRIDFPLIADLSTQIARQYGMIHPNANSTKTVRAVFFIDPKGIIRTILYYPASTGRNFDEIKRILISLQLNDEFGVSTPADWQPSDDVILPNPCTLEDALQAQERNTHSTDVWFLSFAPMPVSADTPAVSGQNTPKPKVKKNKTSDVKVKSSKSIARHKTARPSVHAKKKQTS